MQRSKQRAMTQRHNCFAACVVLWAATVLQLSDAAAQQQQLQQQQQPAATPNPYGSQLNPMGYHEGARRTLRCDGGHVTGFDAYMFQIGGFAESTVNALRIVCSSSRIQLEYETGSLPDSLVFGNLPPELAGVQPIRVVCPAGTAVAGVDWRRVAGTEKDNTARIAGFAVHCGSEVNPQPLVVDSKPNQQYPAQLKCSGTSNAPSAGTQQYRLTAIEVWYEQLLSGLHLISCTTAAQ